MMTPLPVSVRCGRNLSYNVRCFHRCNACSYDVLDTWVVGGACDTGTFRAK